MSLATAFFSIVFGIASLSFSPTVWASTGLLAIGGAFASGGLLLKNKDSIKGVVSKVSELGLSKEEIELKHAFNLIGVDPKADIKVIKAVYNSSRRKAERENRVEDANRLDTAFQKTLDQRYRKGEEQDLSSSYFLT